MNIAIFSGELSGDLIGGALARELKRQCPEGQTLTLWGLGSRAMEAAGVELIADSAEWGVISITQVVARVPGLLLKTQPMVKREIRRRKPDLIVMIDFGAFNLRAARYAKSLGIKICYYVPPGCWRRKTTKGAEFAELTDVVATPFPWSETHLRSLGVNAHYVGHPIVERVGAQMTRAQFADHFGMDPSRPIIGLLPGSRLHEIDHLMPLMLDSARLIYEKVKDAQFVVAVADTISQERMAELLSGSPDLRDKFSEIWHEFAQEAETKVLKPVVQTARKFRPKSPANMVTNAGLTISTEEWQEKLRAQAQTDKAQDRQFKPPPPTVLAKGMTYEVMAHSDLLLVCSGTATLEATLFETPMVILYRGSKLMKLEYKLRGLSKTIANIGLPNILADRRIVPELLLDQATPENVLAEALPLLNDVAVRARVKQDLHEVHLSLGEKGAAEKTAHLIFRVLR